LHKHRAHDVIELMRTAKVIGYANNDGCGCNVCSAHREKKEWQNRKNNEYNKGEPRTFTVSKLSVLNNLYSSRASKCHLNKYYIQDDSAEEVIEEFNDVDGRGVPPKRYVWKESKGKHATKILKEHGVDDLGFEKYSNLLVLIVGVNNRTCRLLLDTGSEVDVISTDWVAKFKDRLNLVDEDVVLQLAADDVVAEVKKKAKGVRLDLFPQSSSRKYSTKTDMLIMNTGNNKFDGIIGIKTMAKLGINVTIPRFSEAAAAAEKEDNENKKRGYVLTNNVVEDDKDLKSSIQHMIMSNQFIRKSDWTTMKNGVIDFTLTEEQLREAYRTNTNYVSLAFFDAVDEQVQKWMQEGVIEVNNENTPINLPLLAIKQNNTDGSLRKVRVCVDYS